MPHVVIQGDVDLGRYARDFEARVWRFDGDVLRIERAYVTADARLVLVEALAIEAGRKQPFYIRLSGHDRGSVTVRIDPLTHPERSEGVRRLVAEIGAQLLRQSPAARVRVTNLVLPSGPDEPAAERGTESRLGSDGCDGGSPS